MSDGLPGAGRAGHLGQRLLLQRDRGAVDLSDADGGHGRGDPDAGERARSRLPAARATGSCCSAGTAPNSAARPTCGCSTASSRGGRRRWTWTPSCAWRSCCASWSPQGSDPHRARPVGRRLPDRAGRGLPRPAAWARPSRCRSTGPTSSPRRQARAIVACAPAALDRVLRAAEEAGVPAAEIGEVGGEDLVVRAGGETSAGAGGRPARDLVDGAAEGAGA